MFPLLVSVSAPCPERVRRPRSSWSWGPGSPSPATLPPWESVTHSHPAGLPTAGGSSEKNLHPLTVSFTSVGSGKAPLKRLCPGRHRTPQFWELNKGGLGENRSLSCVALRGPDLSASAMLTLAFFAITRPAAGCLSASRARVLRLLSSKCQDASWQGRRRHALTLGFGHGRPN